MNRLCNARTFLFKELASDVQQQLVQQGTCEYLSENPLAGPGIRLLSENTPTLKGSTVPEIYAKLVYGEPLLVHS